MKSLANAYKALWRQVDKEEIHLHTLDFTEVCRRIDAPQAALDNLLRRELGLSGAELLRELRHRHLYPCRIELN